MEAAYAGKINVSNVDDVVGLGHRNIQNTRIYAQITNPLREQVFRELEQHPKIVRV